MTAIAFVAGMMPLLIATGPGAEERRSIAVLVVGGRRCRCCSRCWPCR